MSARTISASDWSLEQHRFVEAGGNTTHAFGLGRMIGRIYAMLYLTPSALSLEEIAQNLRISKASASTVLRQLASLQAVREIWVAGDRRDFYEAETDFSVILRKGLMPGIRKKLHTAGSQIKNTIAATPSIADPAEHQPSGDKSPRTREELAELRRRLRAAQQLHQRLDRLLGSTMLARFL